MDVNAQRWSIDLFTGANMLTKEQAYELAEHWVQAWNSHVLDEIMSHYEEDVVLVSPIAAKILNVPLGIVNGKAALRNYFKKGLELYPDLKFELIDVMWGLSSVVVYYINQTGSKAGEFLEVNSTGKITKVIANYNS
jgi:ketosteroid isomerase-like protein